MPPEHSPQLDINFVPASAHDAMVKKCFQDHPLLDSALPVQHFHKEFQDFLENVRVQLGTALDILLPDFVELLAQNDTDGAWELWCSTVEDSFADFLHLTGKDRKTFSEGVNPNPRGPRYPTVSPACFFARAPVPSPTTV